VVARSRRKSNKHSSHASPVFSTTYIREWQAFVDRACKGLTNWQALSYNDARQYAKKTARTFSKINHATPKKALIYTLGHNPRQIMRMPRVVSKEIKHLFTTQFAVKTFALTLCEN
jgi:hypothetical protein